MSMMDTISILVGVGGVLIAFITLWTNSHKNTKDDTKETIEIRASLQSQIDILKETFGSSLTSIDNGIRDLKADNRGFRTEITNLRDEFLNESRAIHDEAKHAIELAEAAHRRLDRLGAEPDPSVHK